MVDILIQSMNSGDTLPWNRSLLYHFSVLPWTHDLRLQIKSICNYGTHFMGLFQDVHELACGRSPEQCLGHLESCIRLAVHKDRSFSQVPSYYLKRNQGHIWTQNSWFVRGRIQLMRVLTPFSVFNWIKLIVTDGGLRCGQFWARSTDLTIKTWSQDTNMWLGEQKEVRVTCRIVTGKC